ncbi:MAG TPA: cytochrome c-type biogenesis protein CcmH [Bryobacteraceae bacterium]|nr:cytochrome c-type biogenesis protein CcmH [Bryobacteraceae bacterium]
MQRFKTSLLLVLIAAAALAQTAVEKPSIDARRVGARVQCQCGCQDAVSTCSMLECSFSKPAKERIARMQAAGASDQTIIDAFVKDYGPGIYLSEPNAFGWVIPYALLGAGLVMIWLFIRRYYRPKAATNAGPVEIDDPALAKYKDQIENDLGKLE